MAKDPAYLFYPGDVLKHINLMNNAQRGLYLTILANHMEHICFTYDTLMIIISNACESDQKAVMNFLTEVSPGHWCIEWAYESIQKRRDYAASRGANRLGNAKKEDYHMNNISTSHEYHTENEIVIENVNTPEPEKYTFEQFWNLYGKKDGKKNSEVQWKKLKPEEKVLAVENMDNHKGGKDKKYWKDPERYLKDKRWEDEPRKTTTKQPTLDPSNEW